MAEIKWIKIETSMFSNSKIKHIRSLPEGNNILLIWIMILARAGTCNAGGYIFLTENIPYTEETLASEFDMPVNTIKLAIGALKRLDMITQNEDGFTFINGWNEHQNAAKLDEIREYNRLAKQKSREKQRQLCQGHVKDSSVNVIESQNTDREVDKDIDKNKKKDIDKEQIESIWKLYPLKKGKANAVKKIPKLLKKYGFEQLQRCIERYKRYVEYRQHTDFRELKYQNGSTFFNGTYEDYLDENWKEGKDGRTEQYRDSSTDPNREGIGIRL